MKQTNKQKYTELPYAKNPATSIQLHSRSQSLMKYFKSKNEISQQTIHVHPSTCMCQCDLTSHRTGPYSSATPGYSSLTRSDGTKRDVPGCGTSCACNLYPRCCTDSLPFLVKEINGIDIGKEVKCTSILI